MSDDWFSGSGRGGAVELSDVLGPSALDGVSRLVAAGALVALGLSRDGGALGVTVTLDGRWRREWFRSEADELEAWLGQALEAVVRANGGVIATSGPAAGNGQRRSRGRQKGL